MGIVIICDGLLLLDFLVCKLLFFFFMCFIDMVWVLFKIMGNVFFVVVELLEVLDVGLILLKVFWVSIV